MRRQSAVLLVALAVVFVSVPAGAQDQDAPRPIGLFVVDLHGTFPKFPNNAQLATSRGLSSSELPGIGLGLHAGAHLYVFRWKAVTVGLGGDIAIGRSHSSEKVYNGAVIARAVTERFTHIAPQLSLNFGTRDGWSYLSGGVGPAKWSLVPDGAAPTAADEERLQTINYGGGARWFAKKHLAVSFDVRFYQINPGTPDLGRPGSPRTTLFVAGGGISVR